MDTKSCGNDIERGEVLEIGEDQKSRKIRKVDDT